MTNIDDGQHNTDHLRKGEDVKVSQSLVAGSVSGLLARTVIAPLDTLKIRLQLRPSYTGQAPSGLLKMMKGMILNEGGLRSFWKGNVPGTMMYVLYGGAQFSSYSFYNNLFGETSDMNGQLQSLVVGALAGMTSSFVSYPTDVLRTRFIANQDVALSSLSHGCKEIWNMEGIPGFFRGCTASMFTITLSASILFGTYESIKIYCDEYSKESDYTNYLRYSASSISGVTSKMVTYPLDTIRRRIQVRNSVYVQHNVENKIVTEIYQSYKGAS